MAADYWQEFYRSLGPPPTPAGGMLTPTRVTGEGLNVRPVNTVPINSSTGMPFAPGGGIMGTPSGIPPGTQVDPNAPPGAGNAGQPSGFGVGPPLKAMGYPSEGAPQSWSQRAWESGPGMAPHVANVSPIGGMWPKVNSGANQRIGEALVASAGNGNIFDSISDMFGGVVKGAGDLASSGVEQVGNAYTAASTKVGELTKDPLLRLAAMLVPSTAGTLQQRAAGQVGLAAYPGQSNAGLSGGSTYIPSAGEVYDPRLGTYVSASSGPQPVPTGGGILKAKGLI